VRGVNRGSRCGWRGYSNLNQAVAGKVAARHRACRIEHSKIWQVETPALRENGSDIPESALAVKKRKRRKGPDGLFRGKNL
jgi:hypothetical protein